MRKLNGTILLNCQINSFKVCVNPVEEIKWGEFTFGYIKIEFGQIGEVPFRFLEFEIICEEYENGRDFKKFGSHAGMLSHKEAEHRVVSVWVPTG